jgi:hypothetical protein
LPSINPSNPSSCGVFAGRRFTPDSETISAAELEVIERFLVQVGESCVFGTSFLGHLRALDSLAGRRNSQGEF